MKAAAFWLLLVMCSAAWADAPRKALERADYVAGFGRLERLVAACQASAPACDEAAVGPDVEVGAAAGSPGFAVRWDWLRRALHAAADPKLENRAEMLSQAQARLVAERAEAEGTAAPAPTVAEVDARSRADAILRESEFSRVRQQNYLEQKLALLRLWLDRLLMGAADLVPHSPWVGLAIEWGAVGLAAAGLLAWVLRVSRQQRVAISAGPRADLGWEQESDDWAERARTAAARGDWREAVHCLYWAAIVMLEGQRLWRTNRARTPREYVRLLEPGTARRAALGGLTGVFERIWYGLRPAAEQDYRQAEALLAELKAGPN